MSERDNQGGDDEGVPEQRTLAAENRVGRRAILKGAGISAATAALAGCGSLLGDSETNGGQTGGGTITSDELQAGLLSFEKGQPAVLGKQAIRGAQKAVERINANGGIGGRRLVSLDVKDETDNATQKYETFIDEGKDVTFGPISSSTHELLAPKIENTGVINVGTDGTVTSLYEETITNPTYSFRFQNYDVMEVITCTLEAVGILGAENIETVAGINPNYAFGQDEMDLFKRAIDGIIDRDVEVVYEGFPDLSADNFTRHIQTVKREEPDLVFTATWGGDASKLLSQAFEQNMFRSIGAITGPVFYGSADAIEERVVTQTERGKILAGSRNYYWDVPATDRSDAGQQFFEEAVKQEDITVPTAHYMSGYGAVTAWATAVEKAIDLLGTYPSQEEIARTLEGHSFYTPGGHFTISRDHQGRASGYAGVLEWDTDIDAPILTDVNTFAADQISPPPQESRYAVTARDWLDSW